MNKKEAKETITVILMDALNNYTNKYKLPNGHTDWEKVEYDLHVIIAKIN